MQPFSAFLNCLCLSLMLLVRSTIMQRLLISVVLAGKTMDLRSAA